MVSKIAVPSVSKPIVSPSALVVPVLLIYKYNGLAPSEYCRYSSSATRSSVTAGTSGMPRYTIRALSRRLGKSGGGVRGLWPPELADTAAPPPPDRATVSSKSGKSVGGTHKSPASWCMLFRSEALQVVHNCASLITMAQQTGAIEPALAPFFKLVRARTASFNESLWRSEPRSPTVCARLRL